MYMNVTRTYTDFLRMKITNFVIFILRSWVCPRDFHVHIRICSSMNVMTKSLPFGVKFILIMWTDISPAWNEFRLFSFSFIFQASYMVGFYSNLLCLTHYRGRICLLLAQSRRRNKKQRFKSDISVFSVLFSTITKAFPYYSYGLLLILIRMMRLSKCVYAMYYSCRQFIRLFSEFTEFTKQSNKLEGDVESSDGKQFTRLIDFFRCHTASSQ